MASDIRGRKRVDIVFDLRRLYAVGPRQRDDIKSSAMVKQFALLQPHQRQLRELHLFAVSDSLGGMARGMGRTGLHLDEDDPVAVTGDDVDLAPVAAAIAGEDPIALLAQIPDGGVFTAIPEQFGQPTAHRITRNAKAARQFT